MSTRGHDRSMGADTHGTYGTQRRAAAQNRAAIIEAAHELFAADPLAPLNDVAKKAGVGPGTLYRHFPTRNDLILAAYQHDIDRLVSSARDTLDRSPTARAAFTEWFETLAGYVRIKHGLGDALHGAAAQDLVESSWGPAADAVRLLVDACVAEGSMAAGHDPADVIMLMSFLWRVRPDDSGVEQGRRITKLVFSGLEHERS
jgi:AcrR family transcriptional regulator